MSGLVPAPVAALPWRILFIATALAAIGCVALFSAAGGSPMPWALPHAVRFGVLLVVAIGISFVSPERYKPFVLHAYAGTLLLLVVVLALGIVGGGARSWLNLGIIHLQPSELMKLTLVLALARFYDLLPASRIRSLDAVWPPITLLMVPVGLIILQPDLGTAVLLVLSAVTVMFLAGLPLRLFLGGGAALAVLVPLSFSLLMPHQQRRVLIFLDPSQDPLGAGYHLTQSKIAIGSGGILGRGFLAGTQSHLDYLPEQHTDFIFAAIAEEWGMVGGLITIGLLFLLLHWGMQVALRAPGKFERLAAAGLTATIFFYTAVNLMMVMGLAPVVGIPLPLVSHGGSAMMTVMLSLGILMSIQRSTRLRTKRGI